MPDKMNAEELPGAVERWAEGEANVRAVALVGSYARGSARPGSDIDLILLCVQPTQYLSDLQWLSAFGDVRRTAVEDWGSVQSIRAFYAEGPEVEFGVTSVDWAAFPLDAGTAEVLAGGAQVLFDGDGRLVRAIESLRQSA